METRQKVLGPEHPDTLASVAELATSCMRQGRKMESEELEQQIINIRQRTSKPNLDDSTRLYLLSLDGGGSRLDGFSTLYILKAIMDTLNKERRGRGLPVVKPCEFFNLVGGIGTSG
jgi:hypothetical protein